MSKDIQKMQSLIIERGLEDYVLFQEKLARYTSFRIGGVAETMMFPPTEDILRDMLSLSKELNIEPFILGGGSNVLIKKKTLPLVICLRRFKELKLLPNNRVYASAGTPLNYLVKSCIRNGLGGMELLAGIPGTVGGALAGNAGSKFHEEHVDMSKLVREVRIIQKDQTIYDLSRSAVQFDYRQSNLRNFTIVGAVFQLKTMPISKLNKRYQCALENKSTSQPLKSRSAGCVFKNPPGFSAWKLISQAKLVGSKVGAAMVSDKHANFIVNIGGASGMDVWSLIRNIQSRVKKLFDVELCLEVKIW